MGVQMIDCLKKKKINILIFDQTKINNYKLQINIPLLMSLYLLWYCLVCLENLKCKVKIH